MSLNGPKFPAKPIVDCSKDKILTVQADRDEADINKIIARFEKAGMISTVNRSEPFYGDVSEYDGLQDAIIKVQNADALFMGMSAQVRERFANDPVQMMEFLADNKNRAEAEGLGMVIKRPEPPVEPPSSAPGGDLKP